MPFPPPFLDDLRARTPLVALVGRRVKLTPSGRNWKGCCPFHAEKLPSFYVYTEAFHCFGCGAFGDAIAFMMQTETISLDEAVQRLAAEAGISLPGTSGNDIQQRPQGRPVLKNASKIPNSQIDAVMATAARLLVRHSHIEAALLLTNAEAVHLDHWEHDNWNGGQDTWRLALAVPADVYFNLESRGALEQQITDALSTAMQVVSDSDFLTAKIITSLDEDPSWREKVRQHLSGEGITNQGRVRSDNIAARQHEGLLFRSWPEIHFYNAMKSTGVPFAPLSVVIRGGVQRQRIEPDFLIYKAGLVMVLEIDGDLFHTENPAAAHARLKLLFDEGVLMERINASECDTPEKAREAVRRVIATMDKLRTSR